MFHIFNMLTFPQPEADFEKQLTFPLWESYFAPNPGNVKLFALLQQKSFTFPGFGPKSDSNRWNVKCFCF